MLVDDRCLPPLRDGNLSEATYCNQQPVRNCTNGDAAKNLIPINNNNNNYYYKLMHSLRFTSHIKNRYSTTTTIFQCVCSQFAYGWCVAAGWVIGLSAIRETMESPEPFPSHRMHFQQQLLVVLSRLIFACWVICCIPNERHVCMYVVGNGKVMRRQRTIIQLLKQYSITSLSCPCVAAVALCLLHMHAFRRII